MKHKWYVCLLLLALSVINKESIAQADGLQVREGEKLLTIWADSLDPGFSLRGLESLWYRTGDGRCFKAIQRSIDRVVANLDNVPFDKADPYWIDLIGRNILLAYKVTNQEKYYKTATAFLGKVKNFAPSFTVEYAALFHEPDLFNTGTRQLTLHSKTGWELRSGSIGLALVDALDYFPAAQPGRDTLLKLLRTYASFAQEAQDPVTGLWQQRKPVDGKELSGLELFASCLHVYALAKGVRLGYLPSSCLSSAKKGYAGILKKYVSKGEDFIAVEGDLTVRQGDFKSNMMIKSSYDGVLLLAAGEMEMLPDLAPGKGRTVMLDYYFNNEHKKDITGQSVRFHYTWEDQSNSGFSLFGDVFRQFGMRTDSLPFSPDAENLKKAAVYIIVDPDDDRESPSPNYMAPDKAQKIFDWVKAGGVLVLMSNDSANAEFEHFEQLPERFGIHFNWDCYHKVTGNKYEMGAFTMTGKEDIFKTSKKVYIKELSTLKLNPPARPVFSDGKDVIIGVAKVGRGTVFAVGDPWFYNEYFDGRKLPAEYDNFNAAKDLVRWLIAQIPPSGH
jgi:unsaturated rhamnogalacturonyl hydrolase